MKPYSGAKAVNLIVYTDYDRLANKLWRIIKRSGIDGRVEIHGSIESLFRGIQTKGADTVIAMLLINNRYELKQIQQMADLLRDLKIILILPDEDRETVSIGHKLYPRFISYADGDLLDVEAVLNKMVGHSKTEAAR